MWPGPYGNWGSRKYLMASLEQSLRRMNLDYVDLFYSHRFDPETPLEETLQALVDIVRQGKALYIGISRWPHEATEFAYRYLKERDVPCLIYQGCYNLFRREPEDEGILKQAKENGVGFISFSPLAQGLLTDRYLNGIPEDSRIAHGGHLKKESLTEQTLKRIQALNEVAQRRGQSLAEMALAWILKDDFVTSVLIGASSVEQLKKNLKAMEGPAFTTEELDEINAICRM
jgi:L-glyceraldehyde 3-phosphate reductase